MAKQNSRVSAEEFVRIWQEAKDLQEVCAKTKLSTSGATSRAGSYRRRNNIPLKKFYRGRGIRLNTPALIALAKKYAPKE